MAYALEDELGDIAQKARQGLGLTPEEVEEALGWPAGRVEELEAYRWRPEGEELAALAALLRLDAERLAPIAGEAWLPPPIPLGLPQGGWIVRLTFREYRVHCYLLGEEGSAEALLVDTGMRGTPVVEALERRGVRLGAILLTHTHRDHAGGLADLAARFPGIPVYVAPAEADRAAAAAPGVEGALCPAVEGTRVRAGGLLAEALPTPGHTPGGVTWLVGGAAFVGDTLFAGSLGRANGGPPAYRQLLASVGGAILGRLPDETPLFPGHGPATRVGVERRHNPFFPGLG